VGELPAMPVLMGGIASSNALKLKDVADALLYVGPRDRLTQLFMPRSELEGTAYGKELARRYKIQTGGDINFTGYRDEAPAFERPPATASGGPPPIGAPPKSFHDPLPPRPPSK